jgi:thymidylate synthase (FAD)
MYKHRVQTKVLDHGYVQLIRPWGSDREIIEAARMSTQKGFEGWGVKAGWGVRIGDGYAIGIPDGDGGISTGYSLLREEAITVESKSAAEVIAKSIAADYEGVDEVKPVVAYLEATKGDEKLLARLYRKKHATPFEMAGFIIEVQAPIFVFREWHRHRTQSYNEASARYSPLPDLNYIPTVERLMMAGGANKQAAAVDGAEELTEQAAQEFREGLEIVYGQAEAAYQYALKRGVTKELARILLPVGRYSKMRASANLRNWLGFCTLRVPPDAQWEIRQFANVVAGLVREHFPRTFALWVEEDPETRGALA